MRFGDAMKSLFAAKAKAPGAQMAERFLEIVSANDPYTPPPAKAHELIALYNSNLWVRSIVGKIARSVASQPWVLERENGERVEKHPALDWLNAGTKKLRGRAARSVLAVHLDLAGEAFVAIGKDAGAKAMGWAPVPPHWVTNIPENVDDPGAVYEVQPKNGILFRIPAAQMLHIKDHDPLDPYGRGSSNAAPVRVDLDTDDATARYLAAFFKNSARPDFIVSGSKEKPLGDRDRARLEETWLSKFRGVARGYRPFFSAQPLEVRELSKSLRDNAVGELRGASKAIIAEFYGVPPEILGRLDNSNRATIDAADLIFAKHVIAPRLAMLLEGFEPFAVENFGLDGLTLRFENPVQEDRAFQLTVMQSRPTAFTENEFRALAKHKPQKAAGFDEPIKPVAPVDPAGGPNDPNDSGPGGGKPSKSVAAKGSHAADTKIGAELSTTEKNTISPEQIIQVSDAHMDPSVTIEATRLMDDIFSSALSTYGGELLGVLDAKTKFRVNASTANWLAERGSRLISGIDATTRNELRASLVEGAAATEKVAEIVARIEKIFDDAASIRGPVIGITEATAIAGFGSLEAGKQAGFESKKWLTSGDQIVRGTHAAMDGQTVLMGQKFQSPSGAQAEHPGAFGNRAEDINCRCAMRPVLPGEADKSVAKGVADNAFVTAWDGMHARAALKIENQMRKIFAAQKAVALARLNQLTQGAVYE